jgi:hypothetical protein
MKKWLFVLGSFVCFYNSHAQDTTLKEYTGTYLFPTGSVVPSGEVVLKDTVLMVNSIQGSSTLTKLARDTFALVSYDGMAYFTRDSTGKVTGIKVEAGDVLLEGTKDTANAAITQQQPADTSKKEPVKRPHTKKKQ